jgi:hypothetical protein
MLCDFDRRGRTAETDAYAAYAPYARDASATDAMEYATIPWWEWFLRRRLRHVVLVRRLFEINSRRE